MSDFWLRKMKTYFIRIDFDKDGAITRKDFEGMAKRFAKSGMMADENKDNLMSTLTAVWDKYLSAVGGGESLSQDAFIECMRKLVHDPTLKTTLEGPLPLFFKAVDSNDDKMISGEEFEKFFGVGISLQTVVGGISLRHYAFREHPPLQIIGLDPSLATDSFKAIDENGDGLLSLDEFVHAGSDFFLEENDESKPTKLFWGPLM